MGGFYSISRSSCSIDLNTVHYGSGFFVKKMPHFSSFCNQKNFLSTIYRFTSAKIVFLFLTTIDQKQGDYFLRFFLYLFPQPEPKCSGILDRVNALLNTVSFILHTTNHLHMYDEII